MNLPRILILNPDTCGANPGANLLYRLMQSRLFVQFLHVGYSHTEEQVHDDNGDDEDEDGEDGVGSDWEVLELSDFINLSGASQDSIGIRVSAKIDDLLLRIVPMKM